MTDLKKKNLIGVAWPYVNGDLHPGHIAGCYLPADIFARFKRLTGEEVLMVSGADCFGTPITIQADKEGVTPKEIVEKYAPRVQDLLLNTYKISFDSFTKTDTELHRKITQKFFVNLANNGFIIKKSSEQYYSEIDKKFLPDRYVEGECIHCHAKEQRGDQCENCGRSLAVGDLINPYAKLTKNPVSLKSTEHYFVDLSQFKDDLKKYVASHQDDWRRWVWKEAYAWVDELQERAITRDIDWGVEIPTEGIPEELKLEDAENKRFYVWFDAVIGYFSEGVKVALDESVGDPAKLDRLTGSKNFQQFLQNWWKQDDPELKHYLFVGKDNLFFHTLWWQSLLLGQKSDWFQNVIPVSERSEEDRDLVKGQLKLADNVPVNAFLNLENQKFSKSRGIYIDSTKLVEEFGLDSVRFYLASIMPENSDANWKWDDFESSVNAELNGNIGNFIHRTLTFYKNKLSSTDVIPVSERSEEDRDPETSKTDTEILDSRLRGNDKEGNVILSEEQSDESKDLVLPIKKENQELEATVRLQIEKTFEEFAKSISTCEFSKALNLILSLSQFGNKYFNDKEPWKTLTEDRDSCEKTIYNCLQLVEALRILLNPFCPDAGDRLSEILGLEKIVSTPNLTSDPQEETVKNYFIFEPLKVGDIKLPENFKPLFNKIEKEQIEKFNY